MRSLILLLLGCLLFVNSTYSLNKQQDCKCRVQTNRRIIGGRNAAKLAYPWQVTLSRKEPDPLPDHLRRLVPNSKKTQLHSCGGSIINEYWILTAGHCFGPADSPIDLSKLEVGFGDNDLVQIYNKKQYKKIAVIHRHPGFFQFRVFFNDIALIKLNEPLEFSKSVQPACLGFDEKEFYDGVLKISGWGSEEPVYEDLQTNETTTAVKPRFLKEGDSYDYSNKMPCFRLQYICVKNELTHDTACKGDSGGPIHFQQNGKSSVIGLTSFGNAVIEGPRLKVCAGNAYYTRLSTFKGWVEGKIGQNYCS